MGLLYVLLTRAPHRFEASGTLSCYFTHTFPWVLAVILDICSIRRVYTTCLIQVHETCIDAYVGIPVDTILEYYHIYQRCCLYI